MRGTRKSSPKSVRSALAIVGGLILVGCLPYAAAQPQETSRGEALFRNHCMGCHSIRCNRNGPKLLDIIGRRAGAVEGFEYSSNLKNSGIVWSEDLLSEFLSDPEKLVSGTKMTTVSINDPKDRQSIIEFIKMQDKAVDLCF